MSRRRLFPALVIAVAIALALPGIAFADASPSPSGSSPAASPSPSATPTPSKLELDKQKLRQQQAKDKEFNSLLQQGDKLRQAADLALQSIASQLADATARLADARFRAADAQAKLVVVQAQLRAAVARLGVAKDQLASRASHLYIVGPTGYLTYLLEARDINDAMMANEYGNRVLQADSGAVDGFRAAAEDVRSKEEAAQAFKHEIDAQVASAQLEQQALQDLRDRQQNIRTSLFTDMKDKVAELARIAKLGNPFAEVLAAFNATGSGFTQVIHDAEENEPAPVFTQGWLQRPVPGAVTQGFGWRIHPVFGYLSFHTGADLAAEYGDPVHPAQQGKVIDVGYFGPFGLTVLIDHGGSISTVYAHLSEIDVSPGDIVTLHTVIGKVGSTGWATGPHLHFEVRARGVPQEPTRWF